MRAAWLVAAIIVAAASCGRRAPSTQHVSLGGLGYEMQDGWQRAVTEQRGVVTAIFTPEDNGHKESVTVIRTRRRPATAHAGAAAIEKLLARAEGVEIGARASAVSRITTPSGLSGAQIEVDFQPTNLRATCHRVHVVLVSGQDLIHVMYTAADPDDGRAVFDRVLHTISREEA